MGIAQLVRASGCGPEGRGFESHYSPHILPCLYRHGFSFEKIFFLRFSPDRKTGNTIWKISVHSFLIHSKYKEQIITFVKTLIIACFLIIKKVIKKAKFCTDVSDL